MKNELLKGAVFHSMEEVTAAVTVAVDFYNNERPHLSLNIMTPCRTAGCTGEPAKRWTGYRQMAIKSKRNSGSPVINFHAAGMDVGSMLMMVSCTNAAGGHCMCSSGCFTKDLKEPVEELKKEGITGAAIEATGGKHTENCAAAYTNATRYGNRKAKR
jgi:hypothetical protein